MFLAFVVELFVQPSEITNVVGENCALLVGRVGELFYIRLARSVCF